jgi:Ran GTPase-activating protein (RanGAP) involved in mRNA processing and transport
MSKSKDRHRKNLQRYFQDACSIERRLSDASIKLTPQRCHKFDRKHRVRAKQAARSLGSLLMIHKRRGADKMPREIDLSACRLGAAGVALLCDALHGQRLLRLDLSSNQLGVSGARMLASKLAAGTIAVRRLNLSNNALGARGMFHLAEVLARGGTVCEIRELNLDTNFGGDDGVAALCDALLDNDEIGSLSLCQCELASDNAGGVAALANLLRRNTSLRRLAVGYNRIGEGGVRQLCDALLVNSTLRELDLSDNRPGIGGCEALAAVLMACDREQEEQQQQGAASLLRSLKLRACNIDRHALLALLGDGRNATASRLVELDLANNHRMDVDVLAQLIDIGRLPALRSLTLRNCSIADVTSLCAAFKRRSHRALQVLDLSANRLGGDGMSRVTDLLDSNTSLECIALHDMRVPATSIDALVGTLERSNATLCSATLPRALSMAATNNDDGGAPQRLQKAMSRNRHNRVHRLLDLAQRCFIVLQEHIGVDQLRCKLPAIIFDRYHLTSIVDW